MTVQFSDRIKIPAALWLGLENMGLSPAVLLRAARLPLAALTSQAAISTSQYFALWQAIDDLAADKTIGINMLSGLSTDKLPPSLLGAYHARDYRDALQRMARYKRLCAPELIHLTEAGNRVQIEFEWLFAEKTVPAVLVDASMATLLEIGRRGTGACFNLQRVELMLPRANISAHAAYFGCEVQTGAKRNCMHLYRADLNRPFTTYNAELLDILTPALDQQVSAQEQQHSFSHTVSWLLERQLSAGRPDIPTVAVELGVSERTLQRRLTDEGTSFQRLLSAVRRSRARVLLTDQTLDLTEVAWLLGFEDQNSFFRAFRI